MSFGGRDIVLLGPAGAGKGTQARLLATRFGIPHVASGDLLRRHRAERTELGRQAESYMDRGDLVPDALVIGMVMDRLREPDADRGVLLDGFPRTVAQARALDAELARSGRSLRSAVYLSVPVDVLVERAAGRWTCRQCGATYNPITNPPRVPGVCDVCGGELYQRPDDRPEVVAQRIAVYQADTVPVLDYYRAAGLLHEVDGTRTIEEVARDVAAAIDAA